MMMGEIWVLLGVVLAAFVIGSVPSGLLVSRALGRVDPRTAGSGNIGFTNVLRVSGKLAGALTLAGDLGKGWLVGWAGQAWLDAGPVSLGVALVVVLGHTHSIFLRFHGGKGVATAMGALLGVAPWVGVAVIGTWFLGLGLFRYSSGAALLAFGAAPLIGVGLGEGGWFAGFTVALAALIGWRHRANIVRLWAGTEPRMGRTS